MNKNFKKLKIAILFGGKSVEHEVSLKSAKKIAQAIDKNKNGKWLNTGHQVAISNSNGEVIITNDGLKTIDKEGKTSPLAVDVVFPVLHGSFGEDGTVQGILKLAGIPFVGCSVLGSAVGFDKDIAKRLLNDACILNARFIVCKAGDKITFEEAKKKLGMPMFIKPANSGSSVGVSKVKNKKEFNVAIRNAFLFDNKILIEEYIEGQELECAVLGNNKPIASVVGEVITSHSFYSYEAKYLDENGAKIDIPAKISKNMQSQIQKLAIKTFQVLSGEGLSRVDFFIKKNGKIYVNEINTLPGFTNISMYPRLWGESGISYAELIDRLIKLAIERYNIEQKLQMSYSLNK